MTSAADSFRELIRRVRHGDGRAAEQLLAQYESAIRREVRMRLKPSLRSIVDSDDFCQSVLGSFFVRAANGQYELDDPAQLLQLLVTIARNKVIDCARRHQVARDNRPHVYPLDDRQINGTHNPGQEPDEAINLQETLQDFRQRMTIEERKLADLRREGKSWKEIAVGREESPDALRKRLARTIERVAKEMGLDELL